MARAVELLSPAGDWDSLKAAVSEGADAVYFGLRRFNARGRAVNFGVGELGDAVGYCHGRGVRAYLTANTLVKNGELRDFFRMAEDAYAAGADGLIVQELPFAGVLKRCFPDMRVHASTQAAVFNSFYMKYLDGVDRVVMPREMTLSQVRDFIGRTGLEAEVFVQGALCFSVSGQCLMSSFLGGRSGNRGLCAQPCRKRYNGLYLLSTRDLCIGEMVRELADAGVAGFKIEGRLRSPEYVGAATAFYRRLIDDGVFDGGSYADMVLAFSREYTLGGLYREYDVTTPGRAGKRGVPLGKVRPDGSVKLQTSVRVGDGVGIRTPKGVHGDSIKAILKGGGKARQAEAGETVRLEVNAKPGDELELTSGRPRRVKAKPRIKPEIKVERARRACAVPEAGQHEHGSVMLLAKAYSPEDARKALEHGAGRAYYSVFSRDYPGGEVSPYVPRCLSQWNAEKALNLLREQRPASVLCGDLGVAAAAEAEEIVLDISCNAFNDMDVGYYNSLNLTPVISPELSIGEIKGFKDKRFIVYAHGRVPLMTTKYNLSHDGLRDDMGYTFPVRKELECRQILNSKPLGLFGRTRQLLECGVRRFLIDLWGEDPGTVGAYAKTLAGKKTARPRGYTTGNYGKGVA